MKSKFIYIIGKLSKHWYQKWIYIIHLKISTKSYGQHKRSKIKLACQTWHWKDLIEGYNFVHEKLLNWNSCKNIMSSQICKNDVFLREFGPTTWFLAQLEWVLPKALLLLVMALFMNSIAFQHKNVVIFNNKLRGSLYNVLVGWVLQINATRL